MIKKGWGSLSEWNFDSSSCVFEKNKEKRKSKKKEKEKGNEITKYI